MRGNRTLTLVVLILLIIVLGFGGWWFFLREPTEPTPTIEPTKDLTDYTEIVVAIQNIPRGMQLSSEDLAMELRPWPKEYLPLEYYTSLAEVEGKFARMDIPRGSPVYPNMVGQPGGMLSVGGSAAALFSPSDRVAYAIPMDTQGAIAWALKPGDHVDVVAALKMVPVDTEFQTPLPNQFFALPDIERENFLAGTYGRFETLPNGQPALIYPSGEAFPSLVVQLTVQDAVVWHVGIWEDTESTGAAVSDTAGTSAEEGGEGGGMEALLGGSAAATPAPIAGERKDVEPVTLLVTRQDVLVLKYLMEMQADLDLVLRPAGFTDTVIQTQPVWLRFIMDYYQLPSEMPDMPIAPTSVREEYLDLIPQATPETLE